MFQDPVVMMGVCGVEFFMHPWELGPRKAKEFLYTADWWTASEAHRLGMVNHVVPREEIEEFTLSIAKKIAEKPTVLPKIKPGIVEDGEVEVGTLPEEEPEVEEEVEGAEEDEGELAELEKEDEELAEAEEEFEQEVEAADEVFEEDKEPADEVFEEDKEPADEEFEEEVGGEEEEGEAPESLVTDYLEKLIQVPYRLPRMSPAEVETYMTLLFCQKELGQELFERCVSITGSGRLAADICPNQ